MNWIVFSVASLLVFSVGAPAQWHPPPAYQKIPILDDCRSTRNTVGVAIQPNILYPQGAVVMCPDRIQQIEKEHPGASLFFQVHEFGHLVLRTRNEAQADEWAARQLSGTPGGNETLRAVVAHFVDVGTRFDPMYGTGLDRALRVCRAGGIPLRDWPLELRKFAANTQAGSGINLKVAASEPYANYAEMIILVDGQPIGFCSSDPDAVLSLPTIAPGTHIVSARNVWVYHAAADGSKTEIARNLSAECQLNFISRRPDLELLFNYNEGDLRLKVDGS